MKKKRGKRRELIRLSLSLEELVELAQEEAAENKDQRFSWSTYTHHRCQQCKTIQRTPGLPSYGPPGITIPYDEYRRLLKVERQLKAAESKPARIEPVSSSNDD